MPLKTSSEFLRILNSQNGDEDIEILIDPNQIIFKTNACEIVSRLIEGNFPEYQAVIPKQTQTEIVINTQELVNAVKLVSSFSGRGNDITLKVGENKKFLEVYSVDNVFGENRYRVPIKLRGEKFLIIFNWRYFLNGLKIYKSEEIILGINGSDKPATIKSLGEPFLVYVVMPIKS